MLSDDGSIVAQWFTTVKLDAPLILEQVLSGSVVTAGLTLRLRCDGREVLCWRPGSDPDPAPLTVAVEPPLPGVITSTETLVLTGRHLAQYRHATRRPEPYWEEALGRDPGDVRANTELGASLDAGGRSRDAERHFRRALDRLTALAPTPVTGEVHYRLGMCLIGQSRDAEAIAPLTRAAWDAAWSVPSHWNLARIYARSQDLTAAEQRARAVLDRDPAHLGAGCLLASILHMTGRDAEARELLARQLSVDPLHQWTRDLAGLPLTHDAPTLLDVSLDHAGCGAVEDALRVLGQAAEAATRTPPGQVQVGPLIHYHRAALLEPTDPSAADQARATARNSALRHCLASRPEDIHALLAARQHGPDPLVELLLGNWWYERGRYDDAIAAWTEATITADPSNHRDIAVIAHRNLGIAAINVRQNPLEATRRYAAARGLAPDDARLFAEEDQLLAHRGTAPAERLKRLLTRPDLTDQRDDLTVTTAHLLTQVGRFEEAETRLTGRRFQPWEGGEGQVLAAWEQAMLGRARRLLQVGEADAATAMIDRAIEPPSHLGEARHPLSNTAELLWWSGRCLDAAGRPVQAQAAWEQAAEFETDFSEATTVRDSINMVSSILALRALGRWNDAEALLGALSHLAHSLAEIPAAIDYFATSLPSMLLFHHDPQQARDSEVNDLRAALAALNADPRSLVEPTR